MYPENQSNNNYYGNATQTPNPPSNYPAVQTYQPQQNYYQQPANPNQPPYYYQQPAQPNYATGAPAKKSSKGLIIGAIAGLIALVAIVGVVIFVVAAKPADKASDNKANSTAVVATTPGAVTPGATKPATTPGAVNNPTTSNVLVYGGARKLQVPQVVQDQLASQLSSIPNGKVEIYATKDAVSKVKTYYQTDLIKAGWTDMTDEALAGSGGSDTVEQAEALGGFIAVYQKQPNVACIVLFPGEFGSEMGITGVADGETLIFVISGKA